MHTHYNKSSVQSNSALLESAKQYHDRGWSLFPVNSRTKKPAMKWMPFQSERPSFDYLAYMFRVRRSSDALAVVSGEVSDMLAVRDWDDEESYHKWADKNNVLSRELPAVKTRRGYHVYSRAPKEAFANLGDGEYRGNSKHYALLPPSPNYQWIVPLPNGPLPIIEPEVFGFCERNGRVGSHILPKDHRQQREEPKNLTLATVYDGSFASTVPTGEGQRNSKLFDLARHLKPLAGTLADAEPSVREWHQLALPFIATKEWETTWQEFCRAWYSVKLYPRIRWADITTSAREKTITGYSGATAAILQLCFTLQSLKGPDRSFALSCRLAGDYANVSYSFAARAIKRLVKCGVLALTKAGSRQDEMAAEYRLVKEIVNVQA